MTDAHKEPDLSALSADVAKKVGPFLTGIIEARSDDFQSIYVVGSAATLEFSPDRSDFNTLFVLKEFSIDFLDFLAPMGKKFGRKRIQAPTIMTAEYINNSLDVYPVEFLQYKRVNRLVFGEDVLKDIEIKPADLRLQIERELKGRLIGLRQGYIASMGRRPFIRELLIDSIPGLIPLLSGLLFLLDKEIPELKLDTIRAVSESLEIDLDPVAGALTMRRANRKPGLIELKKMFEGIYDSLEKLARKVNDLEI
ncbi:hypothetical protein ACFLT7_02230 [candidate division KSB1 bacterium]